LKAFEYHPAGEIIFGNGRISEIGTVVRRYGQRCLIVSGPKKGALADLYPIVGELLEHRGLEWEHFEGVNPNPTVALVSTGAELARAFKADVILGIGGGSSLAAAKAISVEATHQGISWDYLAGQQPPTARTLPVVAVGTTAGSGSQVNRLAAITNTGSRDKFALSSDHLIPRAAIIDPQLMLSVPTEVTAAAGFAAFSHACESIWNPQSSPLTELLGWEAVSRVVKHLPSAVRDGSNLGARSSLAWADTLAGLATCESGLALPHGIALAIGGMFPEVPHGLALASIYRACLEFIWPSGITMLATLARLLEPALEGIPAPVAARQCPDLVQAFVARLGLACTLRDFGFAEDELAALVQKVMVFPYYRNNPRVPGPDEMLQILEASY
jgi:alcohol dehydrogenase class IV